MLKKSVTLSITSISIFDADSWFCFMSSQHIEDLEDDFNLLTKEIAEARAKRDEFNGTTQELIRLIKEHNSHIKDHLKKAQELKEKRDNFNENVQAAKNLLKQLTLIP